jgi:signal transduction histidine kinase
VDLVRNVLRDINRVVPTMPAATIDPVLRAWPDAVLLVAPDGTVRAMNVRAKRLLRLPESYADKPVLAEVLGAAEAQILVGGMGEGVCLIGSDEATTAGRPVLRAKSARLPDGDFLVRLDDVSEETRLRSHLELAERLASIGELLSSVAHELSNPLTTVLGYADLLLSEDDPRIPREEIERIRAEALRCRRIVGNLLDLSRADNFEMRPIALDVVVDKVIEFRAYAAQVGQIELIRDVHDHVPVVNADQHRLVQAVLNLVTNAEDAVRERDTDRRIVLRAKRSGGDAAIEVEDNGPGVPEAIRPYVFEPFFTTKPRGRGTGLGLSLVQATARAHGGTVRVADGPRQGGALFILELPAAS